jgi:predicted nucleic acid-binding Zn finger protein
MKDLYKTIYEVSDHRVRLVSARRWAADEYGNKIDGNAFVVKNGYYKCMNAMGSVMYFKKNNSRHLYGEAIDIINDGIDFMELMTDVIMKNPEVLKLMYNYGISAYIEQAKDDTGVTTKHYHIGTDTVKQAEFWASVKAILGNDKIPGTLITFSNYVKNNTHAELEITRIDVDENSLNQ